MIALIIILLGTIGWLIALLQEASRHTQRTLIFCDQYTQAVLLLVATEEKLKCSLRENIVIRAWLNLDSNDHESLELINKYIDSCLETLETLLTLKKKITQTTPLELLQKEWGTAYEQLQTIITKIAALPLPTASLNIFQEKGVINTMRHISDLKDAIQNTKIDEEFQQFVAASQEITRKP